MSDPLTQAEWKEIEGYLRERPQCSIDEGGAIWVKHSNHGLSCMHPRVFLDICREQSEVYRDELVVVSDLGSILTLKQLRAMMDQLTGHTHGMAPAPLVGDDTQALTESVRYNALYQILRGC